MVKQLLSWGVCCAAGLNPLSWSSFLSPGLPVFGHCSDSEGEGFVGQSAIVLQAKSRNRKKMFAFVCETAYG